MSKIIAFWGKHGAGVSTVAANTAVALASSNKIVTLMSTNLQHGDIQIFFDQMVSEDKGTHMALADQTGHPEAFLTPVKKINENLFIMAVPNRTDVIFTDEIPKERPYDLYRQLSGFSDYLILDVADDINNALSVNGLAYADQVFVIYQSNQDCFFWHTCMNNLMVRSRIDHKVIPVLNLREMSIVPESFTSASGIKFNMAVPETAEAYMNKAAGNPLYLNANKKNREFIAVIDGIKEIIMHGEMDEKPNNSSRRSAKKERDVFGDE